MASLLFWRLSPTMSSWASCWSPNMSEPFALPYSPPRDFNQVMAPFSASPISVHLSGFVSRLFLVAKCVFPSSEQFRGFAALHRLYRQAGFQDEDPLAASKPARQYMIPDLYGKKHCLTLLLDLAARRASIFFVYGAFFMSVLLLPLLTIAHFDFLHSPSQFCTPHGFGFFEPSS